MDVLENLQPDFEQVKSNLEKLSNPERPILVDIYYGVKEHDTGFLNLKRVELRRNDLDFYQDVCRTLEDYELLTVHAEGQYTTYLADDDLYEFIEEEYNLGMTHISQSAQKLALAD